MNIIIDFDVKIIIIPSKLFYVLWYELQIKIMDVVL